MKRRLRRARIRLPLGSFSPFSWLLKRLSGEVFPIWRSPIKARTKKMPEKRKVFTIKARGDRLKINWS
jgi:hypothetical protein